jgi:hypothetical protein
LIEVCGLQWKACVQAAQAAIERLPRDQAMTVRYKDLVTAPVLVTRQILQQIDLDFDPKCQQYIEQQVRQDNLDKWQRNLSEEDLELLMPHIRSELVRHGYGL